MHRWTRHGDARANLRRCTKDGYTWVGRTSQAGFEAGWSTTEDIIRDWKYAVEVYSGYEVQLLFGPRTALRRLFRDMVRCT